MPKRSRSELEADSSGQTAMTPGGATAASERPRRRTRARVEGGRAVYTGDDGSTGDEGSPRGSKAAPQRRSVVSVAASGGSNGQARTGKWTTEEDQALRDGVERYGPR